MAELVILHTGDLHGRLSVQAAERLRQMKHEKGALLLDSGDALPVPNIVAVPWPTAIAQRMAIAGYDAVALGNREYFFRAGGIRWAARSFSFPVIATNVELPNTAGVQRLAVIKHAAGEVVVLGLARCMTRPDSLLQRLSNIRWRDPVEAVREVIRSVCSEARWLVALSHLGLRQDFRLAQECPELDVVLGAHDHVLTVVAPQPFGPPVIHSGCRARTVSVVRLTAQLAPQSQASQGSKDSRTQVAVEVVRL
ncbi:MAG: hypothetical protein N2512_00805 [Armatimonadetes bacterium]|nr:hypothetical protein [Armatimonadota bacterium]